MSKHGDIISLRIYRHTDKLYRYKWSLHNSTTGEDTSFNYTITIWGARFAAKRKSKKVLGKVAKDTTIPIIDEVIES